jgi:hypothetical protein
VFLSNRKLCFGSRVGRYRIDFRTSWYFGLNADVLPAALYRAEQAARRKRTPLGFICVGATVSLYAAVLLVSGHPSAATAGHSTRYAYAAGPEIVSPAFYLATYTIPTILPFFFSSIGLARAIGMALAVSLYAAAVVERDALTSVWCFFAALLSVMVVLAVVREQRHLRRVLAMP